MSHGPHVPQDKKAEVVRRKLLATLNCPKRIALDLGLKYHTVNRIWSDYCQRHGFPK